MGVLGAPLVGVVGSYVPFFLNGLFTWDGSTLAALLSFMPSWLWLCLGGDTGGAGAGAISF